MIKTIYDKFIEKALDGLDSKPLNKRKELARLKYIELSRLLDLDHKITKKAKKNYLDALSIGIMIRSKKR